MRRILFVDDEANAFNGLRRLIHKRAAEWKGYFAQSGVGALAIMRQRPIDVLVTDMRMPRGVTLAALGAYLLGLWGLPYAIMESAYHHASVTTGAGCQNPLSSDAEAA